ncbi:TPA: ATP-binding protein [bacterium]|nr:ATP-binding protein [bacterium]
MERNALIKLKDWQTQVTRLPLILRGARQVGKTWLLKAFGRECFQHTAYINFEANRSIHKLFASDLSIDKLLLGLRVETKAKIEPGKTLIIFDEIQECPGALTALKYFAEEAPQYHVAAAGSLLGVALHAGTSFPVGKVQFLDLAPLSFLEFIAALGEAELGRIVMNEDWQMVEAFRLRLMELLGYYLCVGGMPEVVNNFREHSDLDDVREIQNRLLTAYEQDFSKYAKTDIVPRIRAVWQSIPAQLSREQKKFVYGLIREGARAREYETAIEWLCDAGLAHKVWRVVKPGLPLRSYRELNHFKLYFLDVGLLSAHMGVPPRAILDGDRLFTEYKGALTEQYVCQELSLQDIFNVAYWSADNARSEVDFLIQYDTAIIPLEVKSAENLQAKSLKVYRDKFSPPVCLRTSLSGYRQETWLTNLPLYALQRIRKELVERIVCG